MQVTNIKNNLINEIEKLVNIIKSEYPSLVDIPNDYDLNELVHIEKVGTISLFVRNKHFYFPLDAVEALNVLKKNPGFGTFKNHKTCTTDNMIINDNTYMSFFKHAFLKGLTVEEYFKEILLHEVLHFCGSNGHDALSEGINELKTRQIAQKYSLLTSSCGYPKETKIAYELETIFGRETIDKIAFAKSNKEIEEILGPVSKDASNFFFELKNIMNDEFYSKYMKYKYPGVKGIFQKIQKYNSIDYTKAYELIDSYKENNKSYKNKTL